jgi:hypothetical protein
MKPSRITDYSSPHEISVNLVEYPQTLFHGAKRIPISQGLLERA